MPRPKTIAMPSPDIVSIVVVAAAAGSSSVEDTVIVNSSASDWSNVNVVGYAPGASFVQSKYTSVKDDGQEIVVVATDGLMSIVVPHESTNVLELVA